MCHKQILLRLLFSTQLTGGWIETKSFDFMLVGLRLWQHLTVGNKTMYVPKCELL